MPFCGTLDPEFHFYSEGKRYLHASDAARAVVTKSHQHDLLVSHAFNKLLKARSVASGRVQDKPRPKENAWPGTTYNWVFPQDELS